MRYPENEAWKSLSNPDEIIEFINSHNLSKWEVLPYFASSSKKFQVFEALISSNHFPKEELYQRFVEFDDYYTLFGKKASAVVGEKVKDVMPWTSMTDADEILKKRNRFLSEAQDLWNKLNFFETVNPEIYAAIVKSQPGMFYLKNFSAEQILTAPDSLAKHIGSTIDEDLHYVPMSVNDTVMKIGDILKEKKHAVLKCCMASPETAMTTIKRLLASRLISLKDFAQSYSKEQILALPPDVKSVLKDPSNVWKLHVNPELIYYNIPKGKEWQVFEYYAKKDPSKIKGLANLRLASSPFTRSKIIEHYKGADQSTLPPALQEYITHSQELLNEQVERGKQQAEAYRQVINERHASWLDNHGNLIQYFELKDGIPIASKEDYYQIAEFFKNAGISASSFCHKYQIENIEGFRTMLKRVASEDPEFGAFYEEFAEQQKRDFIATCRNNITGVANGTLSVKEVIENHSDSRNLSKLITLGDSLFEDKTPINQFVAKVVEYYHSRLNSYDESSNELEDIEKMLSFKEMVFFVSPKSLDKIKDGSPVDLVQEFGKSIYPVKDFMSPQSRNLMYGKTSSFKTKIKPYSSFFRRHLYMQNGITLRLDDGSSIIVTDEMVDMADCYAHDHHLFKSVPAMNKLIRAVADGRIQNQAETESYKQALKQQISERIKDCRALETALGRLPSHPQKTFE